MCSGKLRQIAPVIFAADDKLELIEVEGREFAFDPPWTCPVSGRPIVELDFDAGTAVVVAFRELVDVVDVIMKMAGPIRILESMAGGTIPKGMMLGTGTLAAWDLISGDNRAVFDLDANLVLGEIIAALAFAWDMGFDVDDPEFRPFPLVRILQDDDDEA